MEVIHAENQQKWDAWLRGNDGHNSFAQSWEWGEILNAEGKEVARLGVVEAGEILALAQVVYGILPFGWRYGFCPMGPVFGRRLENVRQADVYAALQRYLESRGCIFFRAEPAVGVPASKDFFKIKTIDINPPVTAILDLRKDADELLAGMHAKTRYNVHLAERKNIVIDGTKNLDVFWHLMKKTGSRDRFRLHHKNHYKILFESDSVIQITAYYNHQPAACLVNFVFNGTTTYLYGASDYSHRSLMAPYLLQWHAIQLAKHSGSDYYDFFGIAPPDERFRKNEKEGYVYDHRHQYAGVTRFKIGFGGGLRQRAGTWDLVFKKGKYNFYRFLRAVRRWF